MADVNTDWIPAVFFCVVILVVIIFDDVNNGDED